MSEYLSSQDGKPISETNPLPISQTGSIVTLDSTTTALAINGVYTTPVSFDPTRFKSIVGSVFSDQAGTLYVEQSWDDVNWDASTTVAVTANTGASFDVSVVAPKARLRYVNGATAQTVFRLYAGGKSS